jgi:DNA-directed RNA polymerase subunit RPC12/RpoP
MKLRKTVSLTVLAFEPAPNTRAVLVPTHDGPVFQGSAETSYVCGRCGHVLLKGVGPGHIQNMVIKCKPCGAYNDTAAFATN